MEDVAFTAPYKIMNPFPKKNGGSLPLRAGGLRENRGKTCFRFCKRKHVTVLLAQFFG